jgi:AcrR family transcriptional regulator
MGLGPAAAMPGASKGARTRQALLEAAIARFGRNGYRGTSVAEVARDARLSGTAAYAYFASKESLFVAAVDEDAAAVIAEGLSSVVDHEDIDHWRETLIFTLVAAVGRHPLARRVLAGLEPDFTDRLLTIPALEELRKACGERLRAQQLAGDVRGDVDAQQIANGLITIVLSLLMSLVQLGTDPATLLGRDVTAVVEAALNPPSGPPTSRRRRGEGPGRGSGSRA